jgi:RNA 2',3'-cyclic 3'-phosphodiesterase
MRVDMSLRAFLGIELPDWLRYELVEWCRQAAFELPGARWQSAEQLHITLRFFGRLTPLQIEDICQRLAAPLAEPVNLQVAGAGWFGTPDQPLALWVGVMPAGPLTALRKRIDQRLQPVAIEPDRHPQFLPHVTLARLTAESIGVDRAVAEFASYVSKPFCIPEICLFSSTLAAEGSRYRVEHRIELA